MVSVPLDERNWLDVYERVEAAIRFIEQNVQAQPELKEVADAVGLSEYHFQKVFSRWVGISPKRFLQYLTKEQAKEMLRSSESVLQTAYAAGLSGPGRLHDLFIQYEAVTPGEYKSSGLGLEIQYGFHATPLGECLIGLTPRGVSNLVFLREGDRDSGLESLKKMWQHAQLTEAPQSTHLYAERIFAFFEGESGGDIPLHLRGTNFQLKVWEALLRIPPGSVVTYADIAVYIGMPAAARAVGNAVGRNPLPVIIPCHRVIRKAGEWGGYRWGVTRKKALLGWELARSDRADTLS